MTDSVAVLRDALALPAVSITLLAANRGISVPFTLTGTVAATVKVVELVGVTVHVTPVAVPVLEISSAVKLPALIAFENVIVKLIGDEFTFAF